MIKQLDNFRELLNAKITPIIVNFDVGDMLDNSLSEKAKKMINELNGEFDDEGNYNPPKWYNKLTTKDNLVLVIEDINELSIEEQGKFIELLKYRKISTFELPKNTTIILTINKKYKNKLNEELNSLCAYIW